MAKLKKKCHGGVISSTIKLTVSLRNAMVLVYMKKTYKIKIDLIKLHWLISRNVFKRVTILTYSFLL